MALNNIKGKHLNLEDREYIQSALDLDVSLNEIAKRLEKDPTTISKEIRRNRVVSTRNLEQINVKCQNQGVCTKKHICNTQCESSCKRCKLVNCYKLCPDYSFKECERLNHYPHVCNGCMNRITCKLKKFHYRARVAHAQYTDTLAASREGIGISKSELNHIDNLISPLVIKGQSLKHIHVNHKNEIGCSQRTLYRYFEMNLFTAKNLDLPRKVKFKPRKKNKEHKNVPQHRNGRTYEDFKAFIEMNPDISVVEMDTVHGTRSGKVLFTFLFRSCSLMIGILLSKCTQNCVKEAIDWLYATLGESTFTRAFAVLLTDNGSEFKAPEDIEKNENGHARTRVFFCDPMASYQKPHVEKNHEYIRYVLPKGKSFKNLNQKKVTLMMNHINSTARASLNDKTPFQLAQLLLSDSLLEKLSLEAIGADEVFLKPALLK